MINNKDDLEQLLNSVENNFYDTIRDKHSDFLREFEENTNHQVKTQEQIKREINAVFNNDKYMTSDSAEKIKQIVKNISCLKLLKTGGKSILPQGNCVALFNEIKAHLNEHNIYFLECGEIERFVPDVAGHGNDWLEKVFEKYSDINNSTYDEAKKFIKSVFEIA